MNTWNQILKEEQSKEYYQALQNKLDKEYKDFNIFPLRDNIFKAFELCDETNLKVVILGQDPYHKAHQAQGLAFSTPSNIKNPPSMVNILKEIESDLGYQSSSLNGDLSSWATQGVLLLNTIFTVREATPKSHDKIGWQIFSDNIIKYISKYHENIIFVLWGASSINKAKLIDKSRHYILTAPHPSPLSAYRGFFGSKHFSQINLILSKLNKPLIKW